MRVSWTTIIGCVALAVTAMLYYHTFHDDYAVSRLTAGRGPVFFPRILLAAMFIFSIGVIFEGRREPPLSLNARRLVGMLATIGLTGLYIHGITAAGFLISTVVFVFALPWLLGYRNLKVIAMVTALFPVITWYVFDRLFKIILPSSPWFDAF